MHHVTDRTLQEVDSLIKKLERKYVFCAEAIGDARGERAKERARFAQEVVKEKLMLLVEEREELLNKRAA